MLDKNLKWNQQHRRLSSKNKTIIKKDDVKSLPKPPQAQEKPSQIEQKQEETKDNEEDSESIKSENSEKSIIEPSSKQVVIEQIVEEEKEDENYKEVAILPAGTSFGELALISHKPRAATIRAKVDSHFAVLEKADYQKVYGVIQEKILNRKVNFFKNLTIFSDWTRGAVAKATYYFTEKEYSRGHLVYKELDIWKHTYVVIEGEFEATKSTRMVNEAEEEEHIMKEYVKQIKPSNRLNKSKLEEIQKNRAHRKRESLFESWDRRIRPQTGNNSSFGSSMSHKQK